MARNPATGEAVRVKAKTVAVMYTNNDYGKGGHDAMLKALLAEGDRDGAAQLFMHGTGMPAGQIEWISHAPFWPGMLSIANTLPYDQLLCVTGSASSDWLATIPVPVLALAGGTSDSWASTANPRGTGRARIRVPSNCDAGNAVTLPRRRQG